MPPMIRLRIRHYVVTLLLGLLAGACAHPPGAPKLDADGSCTAAQACPACPACPGQPGQAVAPPAAPPLQASTWRAVDGWLKDDPAQAWPALRTS
nr:murein transglycosylase [Thauera sp.]